MIRTFSCAVLLLSACVASAQFDLERPPAPENPKRFNQIADVTASMTPSVVAPGQEVKIKITVDPREGAWTYPTAPKDKSAGASRNEFDLKPRGELVFVGPVNDPPGVKSKPSEDRPGATEEYYPRAATWTLTAIISPKATPGKKTFTFGPGTILRACVKGKCLTGTVPPVEYEVSTSAAVPIPSQYEQAVQDALNDRKPVTPSVEAKAPPTAEPKPETHNLETRKVSIPSEKYAAELEAIQSQITAQKTTVESGLLGLLTTAALWGFISLVTPCVFPMIPITVSIFLKQSHQSKAETLKLASVYCLTIIVVLGISAFALLKLFVTLSVNPWMNLFLGALFVFFALSLFGWYDLTLPQGMLRFTQRRQGSGGVVGTVFGALAFTIIAFTCVAPFLGGFAGLASSGSYNTFELILGALAFSAAFASPFFLLALFPSLLKSLPRSGGWLDSVKAVMGFLEIAAALKFLRNAEIGWRSTPEYFTYDLVLGGWVAVFAACGFYLLNVFRLPHDEEKPNIGVPRLMFALAFLGLALYLFPALFKLSDGKPQRPSGVVYAWIDAFLLPEPNRSGVSELPFTTDLKVALDEARAEKARTGKPALVFVDFTGEQCTNCRYNENTVFPNPIVKDQLKKFRLVQLYTDSVPEQAYSDSPPPELRRAEGQANNQFRDQVFDTDQNPYYVILEPLLTGGVKVVGVYDEGKINDPARFAAFLREAQEKAATP